MKKAFILLLSLLCIYGFSQGQTIDTEIKSHNVFELSIIKIYPDSFPQVSVVFEAENEFGKPLWQLDVNDVIVTEDNVECQVVSLLNISEYEPLNIGLVFDHSGSMDEIQPDDNKMAIEYAKKGVLNFLSEFKGSEDSILFVGFSDEVDRIVPLTNNVRKIKSFVKRVSPEGGTAFYDALFASVYRISKSNNRSVIIALTDGDDNSSIRTYQQVISYANKHGIRIYTIGLGNVNEIPLKEIATQTNGFYHYTNVPS
jgi:Ca-activated chloride channel family protein